MSTEAEIVALIERLDSHMGQQSASVLLADCRLARDALKQLRAERDTDRGNIRKLLSQQQELLEAILQLAKSSGLPAEMVTDYEQQCQRSAAAIIATDRGDQNA
jgi:hypothetical protein